MEGRIESRKVLVETSKKGRAAKGYIAMTSKNDEGWGVEKGEKSSEEGEFIVIYTTPR